MSSQETIAHYRITSKLGEGGMGAVYRATDTKLNRDVAIKVLPDAFAQDTDRMARFTREAQVLASLNHANIAAVYGVEERAIVMELVEGECLAGPMSVSQAMPIIQQLIDALEYAHEKGIVHRDLKPANIKVTRDGRVKVLDFGLAKALSSESQIADPRSSPTLTMGATVGGMIMGTAGYMAPEQARGQHVDKRADIWSFGAVIYEMLTGEQLFAGPTVSDSLAAVLTREPDLERLPVEIQRLVRQCLVKDVRQRLRDIGDARLLIDTPQPASPLAKTSRRPWLAAAGAGLLAVMLAALLWRATRPVDRPFLQFPVDLGADAVLGLRGTVAVSPDGSRIVYPARSPQGRQVLALRLLKQSAATLMGGTEDGTLPFFSPDGQWVGFFGEGKLKKVSIFGGSAVALCDAPGGRGASWGDDGFIVATLANISGLSRIPEGGGKPEPLTTSGDAAGLTHRWPQVLPGSQAVLYTANRTTTAWDEANVLALSLKTGKSTIIQRGGYFGRFLPGGYLVFIRDGTLVGVPFDAASLQVKGTPMPLIEDIAGHAPSGGGNFDFSGTGLLVYLSGKAAESQVHLSWMDETGKVQPIGIPPGVYRGFRLSPDGKQLAYALGETGAIWVYDLARENALRISSTGMGNREMLWAPDGKHLVYSSYLKDGGALLWGRADGAGETLELYRGKSPLAFSFSQDGRLLAFYDQQGIMTLPLDLTDVNHPKPGKAEVFLNGQENFAPAISPDGRWIAYMYRESGNTEVYVQAFSGASGRWPVSTGGAKYPVWSRDGRRLFYSTADNYVMVVDCTPGRESFSSSKPRRWREAPIHNAQGYFNFDLAPDGKRIVAGPFVEREDVKGNLHLTFLVNFLDEVRRRIPQ